MCKPASSRRSASTRTWAVDSGSPTTLARCAPWGRVLTWDPPREFAFSWLVGPDWGVPGPDAPGSRITVSFAPTEGGTRVNLVHDRLDAHGPGWESVRDGVASDGGWPAGLRQYAAVVSKASGAVGAPPASPATRLSW